MPPNTSCRSVPIPPPHARITRHSTRWTLPLVARLIRKHFGVEYHPGHVWRIVRSLKVGGGSTMQNVECGMDGGRIGWPEMPVAGNRKTEISIVSPPNYPRITLKADA